MKKKILYFIGCLIFRYSYETRANEEGSAYFIVRTNRLRKTEEPIEISKETYLFLEHIKIIRGTAFFTERECFKMCIKATEERNDVIRLIRESNWRRGM